MVHFIENWKLITSDQTILSFVSGYSIEFDSNPFQTFIPVPIKFNESETETIDNEISDLFKKGIIEHATSDNDDEYISNIFLRPKKNGKFRVILNLKHLNNFIEYHHFKMETFTAALGLVSENCFFGSIDLQDAYYSCPVHESDRKFLRFYWNGVKYQYTCLAMGLASAPRIFTKLLKPAFSTLRKRGYANVAYIDDSLLISKTHSECRENIAETAQLLDSLGLTINIEKSVFTPTKCIQFLGFVINSELMSVSLTQDRADSIREKCLEVLNLHKIAIRQFAQLIGKLVSSEPGVRYAPLFYKSLEIEKDKHLKANAGDFEAKIVISDKNKETIAWWIDNVERFPRSINVSKPLLVIKTDSSMTGWGVFNENNGDCYQGECVIGTVLQKITTDRAEATLIAPIWPTQHWFPRLLQMICEDSYLLPNTPGLLTMPNNPSKYHPLRKMRLGAFRVSGNHSKIEAYQMTLKPFYYLHGENRLKNNIGHISENGCHFVVKEKLMYLKQM
nr:uncharacterized protein LOC109617665 isoform X1 [Crassostrea gigas]